MKKLLLLCIIIFLSCTKEISFDIPLSDPKITVNGFIENGNPAKILLTKSSDPFNFNSDFFNLNNNFITGATVVIIDKENNISVRQSIKIAVYNQHLIIFDHVS